MLKNLLISLWVILPVTLLSSVMVYWRAGQMALPGDIAKEGLSKVRIETAKGYIIGGIIFGLFIVFLYLWTIGRWPANAANIFLWLGIGSVIVFSLLAVIVCPIIKKKCILEFIVLNLIWGLGYGWFLPQVLRLRA